ncbi:MAG: hypothetical protein RL660_1607 [Bacteroidota bacterium]|jgi:hypothetical protein
MDTNNPNIELEFSCKEDYQAMSCTNNGRHCSKCNHEVIDCTNMSSDAIAVLQEKHTQGFCGRFALSQMSASYLKAQLISTAVAIAAAQGCVSTNNRSIDALPESTLTPICDSKISMVGRVVVRRSAKSFYVTRKDAADTNTYTRKQTLERLQNILMALDVRDECVVRIVLDARSMPMYVVVKHDRMYQKERQRIAAIVLNELKHNILIQNRVEKYAVSLPM